MEGLEESLDQINEQLGRVERKLDSQAEKLTTCVRVLRKLNGGDAAVGRRLPPWERGRSDAHRRQVREACRYLKEHQGCDVGYAARRAMGAVEGGYRKWEHLRDYLVRNREELGNYGIVVG